MTLCLTAQRSTPYGTWKEVNTVCRIATLSLVRSTRKAQRVRWTQNISFCARTKLNLKCRIWYSTQIGAHTRYTSLRPNKDSREANRISNRDADALRRGLQSDRCSSTKQYCTSQQSSRQVLHNCLRSSAASASMST